MKKTKDDPSWVDTACGKAVKLVYRLLYDLPTGHAFRVLFMRRKLSEVLASQDTMLERLGNPQAGQMNKEQFGGILSKELAPIEPWIEKQPNSTKLDVDYNQMIQNPDPHVDAIKRFLNDQLDRAAMIRVVEPTLHRQRR